MTLYLKYRPQTFEDLDLTSVRVSLKKIISSGQIPHAFLLTGPRGTGKTSAARIIAKAINCESASTKLRGENLIEPCNECDTCKSISKGTNVDVVEMDAASHRGIDDIRSLREAVKLAPAMAKKKIYIIDEAHMLTTEASNALLKTLEEPPEHVVFILATTNPEKLIPTIHSRVTTLHFSKASKEEFVRSLSRIVKVEKIKATPEALEVICEFSDGSFRDAVKILEQLLSEGVKMDPFEIKKHLGRTTGFEESEFLKLLFDKDVSLALNILDKAIASGASAKTITQSLIIRLRGELINIITSGETTIGFDRREISKLIKRLTRSLHDLPVSTLEQIPLELVIVDWCTKVEGEIDKGLGEKKETEEKVKKKVEINKDFENAVVSKNKVDSEITEPEMSTVAEDLSINDGVISTALAIDNNVWTKILIAVRAKNASTEALLRAAQPLSYDGKIVTIAVYYSFHKEKLESNPHRLILEDALSSNLGTVVRILCKLTNPPIKNNTPRNLGQPDTGSLSSKQKSDVVLAKKELVLTEEKDDDIVKIAEKIFG